MSYETYLDSDTGIEIHYFLSPADLNIFPAEIEIQSLQINGDSINVNLESKLMELYGKSWIDEILAKINAGL